MAGFGNKILVINVGSSSLKARLYNSNKTEIDIVIEEIGKDNSSIKLNNQKRKYKRIKNHIDAADIVLQIIKNEKSISVTAHRIVHGKEFIKPFEITEKNIRQLKEIEKLAPLHMPQSLKVLEFLMNKIKARHIAVFDTMFHSSIPWIAKTYAIPKKLAEKHGIKRYGFHGLAHRQMYKNASKILKRKFKKVITCQLGNGASICAIQNGKSVDTSMGFTPLEGLVMGTRSGDIDPFIIKYIVDKEKININKVFEILEKESGLKGLAGENDVRKLLEKEKGGDKDAILALDLFAYRIKKYIGSYISVMNGVDLIVLAGGISRNPEMRIKILKNLEYLGIEINLSAIDKPAPVLISKGKVKVLALETNEEEAMYNIVKNL